MNQKQKVMSTLKKTHQISDIMTTDLYVLNETDSVQKAVVLFAQHKVRHLPVVTNHRIVGMVSHTDIERLCFDNPTLRGLLERESTFLDDLKVADIMQKKPVCVSQDADLLETAELLANEEFHAFPVVMDSDKLIGIVTTTDVIQYLLKHVTFLSSKVIIN